MSSIIRSSRTILVIGFVAALISACAATEELVAVTSHVVQIQADSVINPSETSDSNPVVVKLYQLSDPGVFASASAKDLFLNDVAVLGGTLIGKRQLLPIMPGETREVGLLINQSALFFGAIADFSNYGEGVFRSVIPTPESRDDIPSMVVRLSGANVVVFPPKRKSWWQQ